MNACDFMECRDLEAGSPKGMPTGLERVEQNSALFPPSVSQADSWQGMMDGPRTPGFGIPRESWRDTCRPVTEPNPCMNGLAGIPEVSRACPPGARTFVKNLPSSIHRIKPRSAKRAIGFTSCLRLPLIFLCMLAAGLARAQPESVYQRILDWGEVAVALKGDYYPFGFHDVEGDLIGIEVELAEALARQLGVPLRKIEATSANRLDYLVRGRVELVLATMTDTPLRREQVEMVEPRYFSSGVGVLVPESVNLTDWAQLKGRKVCALQGASFNEQLAQEYGFSLIHYDTTAAGIKGLRDGKCLAWLHEEAAIHGIIAQARERGQSFPYHSPLPPRLSQPWALAIRKDDADHRLKALLARSLAEWHRSGMLLRKAEHWGLPPSRFLQDMNRIWNEKDARGEFLCKVSETGTVTPEECR